jgi:hypothetical protein
MLIELINKKKLKLKRQKARDHGQGRLQGFLGLVAVYQIKYFLNQVLSILFLYINLYKKKEFILYSSLFF